MKSMYIKMGHLRKIVNEELARLRRPAVKLGAAELHRMINEAIIVEKQLQSNKDVEKILAEPGDDQPDAHSAMVYMTEVLNNAEPYNDVRFEAAGDTLKDALPENVALVQRAVEAVMEHVDLIMEYERGYDVDSNEFDESYDRAWRALESIRTRLFSA